MRRKSRFSIFVLFFVLGALFWFSVAPVGGQVTKGFPWRGFSLAGLDRLFHPTFEIVSPVPLRLGLGVKPQPEVVFGGGSSESDSRLRQETDSSSPSSAVVFFQERGDGVRVYSLTGDFDDTVGRGKVSGKPSKPLTESHPPEADQSPPEADQSPPEADQSPPGVDRGEVWGARIARSEKEVSGWAKDSGVTLTLLGVVGIAFLTVIVMVGRKLWAKL